MEKDSINIVDFARNKSLTDQRSDNLEQNMAETFLKKFIQEHNISQAAIARAIDRDKVTVNRYVNGTRPMSKEEATKIASFLKVQPEDIMFPKECIVPNLIIKNKTKIEKQKNKNLKVKILINLNWKDYNVLFIDNPSLYCHNEVWIAKKSTRTKTDIAANVLSLITTDKETMLGVTYPKPGGDVYIDALSYVYGPEHPKITINYSNIISCEPIIMRYNLSYL